MGKKMRLDRFLAEMGVGTRSQIKDMAKKGRIRVNGLVVKKPEEKVDPEEDTVTVDGAGVVYADMEYYMLNKPQGVVSATEDNVHRTVLDLLKGGTRRKDLFPVGRLDIDTEGLLLITNDGELAHRLLSPKSHVDKRYYARVAGTLPADAGRRFEEGITLSDGTPTLPGVLEILDERQPGSREEDGERSGERDGEAGQGIVRQKQEEAEQGNGGNTGPGDRTDRSMDTGAGHPRSPEEDREKNGEEVRETNREKDVETNREKDGKINREETRETNREEDGKANRETQVIVTIREGKFHQVKRMFEALGCKVVFLKRISMGSLVLDESLKPGEYRPLTAEEIDRLQKGES